MKKLLYIEWLKNYSYKPVRIFAIIYFVLLIIAMLIFTQRIPFFGTEINLVEQGVLNFPQAWNFLTYWTAALKIFLGFIIIFTITHEFTNKMFKQNLIDGLSKQEFLTSKILTISFMTIMSTIIVVLVGIILGYNYSDTTEIGEVMKETYFIGGYFLKLFTFLSFLLFLSILVRKSIFVFLVMFLWWVFEQVLGGIEFFAKTSLSDEAEMQAAMTGETFYITKYLPLNSMSELIVAPFQRTATLKMLGADYIFTVPYGAIVACIIYSALFIFGSYYILKKRDF